MLSSRHSFRLISKKGISNVPIDLNARDHPGKAEDVKVDTKKRTFLKMLGIVGVGAVATSLIPRKAEALVFGSTPTSNTVGVKNATNVKINPATEETLLNIKTKSDLFTFDSGTNPANLKVNIAAGDVGIQNASNVVINPATEETLSLIKDKTAQLTFDGSNNLLTASSGGSDAVGVKNTEGVRVNPATDDSIVYLRRMVKLMESQATVDAGNRQRITIDALGGAAVTTTVPVSGSVTATVASTTLTAATAGIITNATIATIAGQNQQMYQDVARNAYANGVRNNLTFS
jgi:hypothetical protein